MRDAGHFAQAIRALVHAVRDKDISIGLSQPSMQKGVNKMSITQHIPRFMQNILNKKPEPSGNGGNSAGGGGKADAGKSKELIVNPTLEVGAGFKLRTRREGARQNILTMKDDPELCRLLIELASDKWTPERLSALPARSLDKLLEFGIVVAKEEAVDEVYFNCSLDDPPPFELIPYAQRRMKREKQDFRQFVVNKGVWVQMGPEPPVEVADRVPHREHFEQSYPVIWVEDPGTKVLAPYWLSNRFIGMVQGLVEGKVSPSGLPPQVSERLAFVNILVPEGYEQARIQEWQANFKRWRGELESQQYSVLRDLLHPLQLAALRQYFRLLDQKGYLIKEPGRGDVHIDRYVWHNEEVARYVHFQITELLNRILPEPVKPSYTYLSTYRPGAVLPRHTDRPQCVWNLSLLVDTNPEKDLSGAWPIYLEVEGETREARLEMGDGVLYRGTEIPHWRDALPDGQTATLIFCHFVPVEFEQSLY